MNLKLLGSHHGPQKNKGIFFHLLALPAVFLLSMLKSEAAPPTVGYPITPQPLSVCTIETNLIEHLFDDGTDSNFTSSQAGNPPIGGASALNNISNADGTLNDASNHPNLNGGAGAASPSGGYFVSAIDLNLFVPYWSSPSIGGADWSKALSGGAFRYELFNWAHTATVGEYIDNNGDLQIIGATGRLLYDYTTEVTTLMSGNWVTIEGRLEPGTKWSYIPNTDPTVTTGAIPATQAHFQDVFSSVSNIAIGPENITNRGYFGDAASALVAERYAIDTVGFYICKNDFSDTPADGSVAPNGVDITSYGIASHSVKADVLLGATNSFDTTVITSPNADSDPSDDGVTFSAMIAGTSTTITAQVSGEGGYLQAWIDWNGDGDFSDAGEQIATDLQDGDPADTATAAGVISFDTLVPNYLTPSPTFVRLRWSTKPSLPSTGPAPDGESEDYLMASSKKPLACNMNEFAHGIYSTASVSANSNELHADTLIYQATFDNEKWQGQVTAFNLKTDDDDGNLKSEVWNTSDSIKQDGRKLFTYKPKAKKNRGRKFAWKNLQQSQRKSLRAGNGNKKAKALVDWVSGSKKDARLRKRDSLLGDIVHSNLNFRSRYTNFGYKQLPGTEGSSYAAYLVSKRNTKDTLFVGSNDGMLHAFNAENGKELFGYIPDAVIPKLTTISNPKYGCDEKGCLQHEYLVDGKSALADAYFKNEWHTVLIGTLGLGGKAVYALDVSDPASFTDKDVLWEISNVQSPEKDKSFKNHLGLSVPEPVVVKMKNGQWAAVIANGYESKRHKAVLFIIDLETGKLIKSINTGFGSKKQKNGLSSPTVVDSDGDYIADVIYAGDLQGNLWSFDVSSTNPADWGSKYGAPTIDIPSADCPDNPMIACSATTPPLTGTQNPLALFRTCMDAACLVPKPITAKPQVGRNPQGGLMVYFGTGKYNDIGENFSEDKEAIIDTFYGLHDDGIPVNTKNLVEQKILHEVKVSSDLESRVTTTNTVSYPEHQGWYMDLVSPPSDLDEGERVISQALLREGRIIFVTIAPSQTECEWTGSSWLMELNALDGKRLSVAPIDTNDDKQFTDEDNVSYNGQSTFISGVQQKSLGMIFDSPAIIGHNSRTEGKYLSGTAGVGMLRESSSRFSGRMSWKKLR